MAEGLNKVMLIGNLGADPELRFMQGGGGVLKLRLATNESYPTKTGERQERTEWHQVVVFGPRAEALNKILQKGKQLYIEGRIQTRSWDDKEGQKRYTTEVVANNIVLLGGGGGGGRERSEDRGPSRGGHSGPPPDYEAPAGPAGGDDDIPF